MIAWEDRLQRLLQQRYYMKEDSLQRSEELLKRDD